MFEQSTINGRQNIKKKNNGTHIGSDLPYYALMIIPNPIMFVSGMLLLMMGIAHAANRTYNWLDENYEIGRRLRGAKDWVQEKYGHETIGPHTEQDIIALKKKLIIYYNWGEGKPF